MSHSTWYNVMPVMPLQQTKFLGRTFWFPNRTITHNYYNWLTYSYIYTLYISMAVCDWTWVKKKIWQPQHHSWLSHMQNEKWKWQRLGGGLGMRLWPYTVATRANCISLLSLSSDPSSHHPPSPTYAIPSSVPFPSPIFNLLAPSPIFPFSPHTINHDL